MAARLYTNNYTSTLATAAVAGDTTLVITNATGLPTITGSDYYYLTLAAGAAVEIVKVTTRTGTSLTVTRAQESTTAQAWAAGTIISLRPTASSFSTTTIGPGSSTDNAVALWSGTTGYLLKNSGITTDGTSTFTGGTWNATVITVTYGGSGRATATAYAPIVGGTTATGAHQSMASGSAGQMLQSAGNASVPTWSTPTYPSASATARKLIISDGTNWTASTETYAVPGSAGNLLRSDGTNWTAAKAALTTDVTGVLPVANGGTNANSASITAFNNITGFSAAGSTGTTSTNIVFSTSPTLVTPLLGTPTSGALTNCTSIPVANATGLLAVVNGGTGVNASNPLIQRVSTQTGAVATGTTLIPIDDTIPQNTEGDQYLSLSITPKNASNILVIDCFIFLSSNFAGATGAAAALFQDSTANALAAIECTLPGQFYTVPFHLVHTMTAGTTSATTFKVRAGANNVGTTSFNGQSGGRLLGGVMSSGIIIREYAT